MSRSGLPYIPDLGAHAQRKGSDTKQLANYEDVACDKGPREKSTRNNELPVPQNDYTSRHKHRDSEKPYLPNNNRNSGIHPKEYKPPEEVRAHRTNTHQQPLALTTDESIVPSLHLPRYPKKMEFRPSIEFHPPATPHQSASGGNPQAHFFPIHQAPLTPHVHPGGHVPQWLLPQGQIYGENIHPGGYFNVYGQQIFYYGPAPPHTNLIPLSTDPRMTGFYGPGVAYVPTPGLTTIHRSETPQITENRLTSGYARSSGLGLEQVWDMPHTLRSPLDSHPPNIQVPSTETDNIDQKLHHPQQLATESLPSFAGDVSPSTPASAVPLFIKKGGKRQRSKKYNRNAQHPRNFADFVSEEDVLHTTQYNEHVEPILYSGWVKSQGKDGEWTRADLSRLQGIPYNEKMERWMDFENDELCPV